MHTIAHSKEVSQSVSQSGVVSGIGVLFRKSAVSRTGQERRGEPRDAPAARFAWWLVLCIQHAYKKRALMPAFFCRELQNHRYAAGGQPT